MQRSLRQRRSFLMRAKHTTRLRESGLLQCDRSQQRITPSRGQVLPSPPPQFWLGPFGDLFQTEPPDIKRARKLWNCLIRRSGWKFAFSSRLPAATTSLRFCRKTVSSHPAVAHTVNAVFFTCMERLCPSTREYDQAADRDVLLPLFFPS